MPDSLRTSDNDKMLLIRLAVSLALIVASIFTESFLSVIFAVAAAVISGYDIILSAYSFAVKLDIFNKELLVVISAIILFICGCFTEGAAVFPAYHIGMLFFNYGKKKTEQSGIFLLDYCGDREKKYLLKYFELNKQELYKNSSVISASAAKILLYAAVFALVFGIISPLLLKYSFAESFRRIAGVIIICSSFSVSASSGTLINLCLCKCASLGIAFSSGSSFAGVADCDSVAVEKEGVLTTSVESGALFSSEVMDTDRMIMLCAHAVFNSQQPFSKPILNVYNGEINQSIISDFKEINGIGVGVMISGMHIVLAIKDYYKKRGVDIPVAQTNSGQVYYLTINGKYAGSVSVNENLDEKFKTFTDMLRESDIEKCALITLDSKESAEQTAVEYGFDYFYPDCYKDSFERVITDISKNSGNVLFIHSESEHFKKAFNEISVNVESSTNHVYKDSIDNIPCVISLSNTVRKVEEENAVIVFIVKSILIALAIMGIGKAWFSVFVDLAAASATFLSSLRLTAD